MEVDGCRGKGDPNKSCYREKSQLTFEGFAGTQFAHTAGCRAACVAAFLTKELRDMGDIIGDCGEIMEWVYMKRQG